MTRHYYNENDPYAAQWLRNLIQAQHIPPGMVDDRSIVAVQPQDLEGYDQCHFFCGIAGWPLALAMAGWPVDRPVWTASCPCQPLSSAGRRQGDLDERHLWPALYRLLAERRPAALLGEQVAGKDGREWFAAVRADMEGLGYACGAADLCAAGAGAPHIRQRLYFMAHPHRAAGQRQSGGLPRSQATEHRARFEDGRQPDGHRRGRGPGDMADAPGGGFGIERDAVVARGGGHPDGIGLADSPVADARSDRRDEQPGSGPGASGGAGCGRDEPDHRSGDERGPVGDAAEPGRERQPDGRSPLRPQQPAAERAGRDAGAVADAANQGRGEQPLRDARADRGPAQEPRRLRDPGAHRMADADQHGPRARDDAAPTDGHRSAPQPSGRPDRNPWADLAWIPCRDGKARPTQPGLFPLAHGISGRVGRLRAYGNAIVPPLAALFIEEARAILDHHD